MKKNDFIALIRPHILPMFLRKIDYQEYLKWRKKEDIIINYENDNEKSKPVAV